MQLPRRFHGRGRNAVPICGTLEMWSLSVRLAVPQGRQCEQLVAAPPSEPEPCTTPETSDSAHTRRRCLFPVRSAA